MGSLAIGSFAMGDLVGADRWFREALTLAESASTVGAITGLGAWSRLLGYIGHPRLGARLEGAYDALSQTYGISMARGLREVVDLVLREAPAGRAARGGGARTACRRGPTPYARRRIRGDSGSRRRSGAGTADAMKWRPQRRSSEGAFLSTALRRSSRH